MGLGGDAVTDCLQDQLVARPQVSFSLTTTSVFDAAAETGFRGNIASFTGVSASQVSLATQASSLPVTSLGRQLQTQSAIDIVATIAAASATNAVGVRSALAGFSASSASSYFGIPVTGTPSATDTTNAAAFASTFVGPALFSASGLPSSDDDGPSTGLIIGLVAGGVAVGARAVACC